MSNPDKINLSGNPNYFDRPNSKPITKAMAVNAIAKTGSNHAAARYLNVSFNHWKKFAKLYIDEESGLSLFEVHKNKQGKGIPKFFGAEKKKAAPLLDIIEGRVSAVHYNPERLRIRMVQEGYLLEECHKCGFKERRVLDYKIPLLLFFKDNNKKNYKLDNVEHLCYNCYFLTVGDVFTERDVKEMEHYAPLKGSETKEAEWGLDDYQLQRLKELGLAEDGPVEDGSEFISKW